jgi:hypothetical protein
MEKRKLHCWWECKLMQLLWKAILISLKNLIIVLSYNPTIPVLGIYPKECAPGFDTATCKSMFIVALFIIAKIWNFPDAPWLVNGLRKCGIYTQYSFIQP